MRVFAARSRPYRWGMATAVDYSPDMSVLKARTQYFSDNGFGDDGGYGDRWVTLIKLGPLRLGIPNTPGRIRAVRFHDLHHLVTGYDTDLIGEAEIGAWELASGCERFPAAVVLNTLALPIGVLRDSTRIERAFARGCRSRNLYGEPFAEALLDERLGELRRRLEVDDSSDADLTLSGPERGRYRRFATAGFVGGAALLLMTPALLAALVLGILWATGG